MPEGIAKKGCLSGVVALKNARKFLYHRLKRLLVEQECIERVMEADDELDPITARSMIERLFYQENFQKGPKWEDNIGTHSRIRNFRISDFQNFWKAIG